MSSSRRFPTPRVEGMANIMEATRHLLESRNPGQITIREIAEASGHHHRLIIEWFGTKAGLLATLFEEIFENVIESGEMFTSTIALRRDVHLAFRLFNYMQMHHPEFVLSARPGFPLESVEQRLREVGGLDPERAHLAARQLAVHTLGLSLFAGFLGLSDDEVRAIEEWEIATLIAHPPEASSS